VNVSALIGVSSGLGILYNMKLKQNKKACLQMMVYIYSFICICRKCYQDDKQLKGKIKTENENEIEES